MGRVDVRVLGTGYGVKDHGVYDEDVKGGEGEGDEEAGNTHNLLVDGVKGVAWGEESPV